MIFLRCCLLATALIYSVGMAYVYLAGEYTAFIKKFWPYYFPLVILIVLLMIFDTPGRRRKP